MLSMIVPVVARALSYHNYLDDVRTLRVRAPLCPSQVALKTASLALLAYII